ncbi:MAG: hypothetical protein JWR80_3734 [Bradyrhizobium sp.]|nr:hypothetical protein [Bradyrhizobium sp.]
MSNDWRPSPRFLRHAGRYGSRLAGIGLAFELIIAAPAMAAAPAAPPTKPVDAAAATGDQAQAAEPATSTGDIIVTAQRREERMQSIPSAISAVSAATLEQANIKTATDIGKLVPGTLIQETVGTATVFVRGVGSNQLGYGNSASNAIYIDGVYQTRVSPVMLRLNSVERVEVLKGPQGTLFGRNSESGLIQIVTRTPSPGAAPRIEANFGYGSYNTVDTDIYMSGGLGDKAAFDISLLYHNQQDGYGYNSFIHDSVFKGHAFAVRSKLVVEPAAGTRFVLTGYYSKSKDDLGLFGYYRGNGAPPHAYPLGTTNLNPPAGFFDRLNQVPEYLDSDYYGGSLRASQELGFADLVSITSLARIKEHAVDDADYSPTNFLFDENYAYDRTFTQELQLVSKSGAAVSWVVGGYYLNQDFGYSNHILSGDGVIPIPGATILAPAGGNTKSYAVYGQVTFPIVEHVSLTLGGRYSIDDQSGFGVVNINIPGVGVINAQPYGTASTTSKKPLWKATLEYKFNSDALIYLTNSRGSKAGAYNLVTFDPVPVKPETLDAYEFGFKTQFFERRLRLNGAVFYYDIKDPQVFQTTLIGTNRLVNAGSARVKGAELEFEGAVTPDFTVRGAVTYLDAKYRHYTDAPFYFPNPAPPYGYLAAVPGDASGNRLSRAPSFSGHIGAMYRIRTGAGDVNLSADYTYTGKFYWDADNFVSQPAYGLLDARISYTIRDTGVKVSVWGTNLTNTHYYVAENQFSSGMGSEGFPGAPRQYGVTVGVKF